MRVFLFLSVVLFLLYSLANINEVSARSFQEVIGNQNNRRSYSECRRIPCLDDLDCLIYDCNSK